MLSCMIGNGQHNQSTPLEAKFSFTLTEGSISLLSVSDSVEALLGYKAEDFLSKRISLKELIHPHDNDIADLIFANHLANASDNFNIRIRQANQRIRCITGHYKQLNNQLELFLQCAKSLSKITNDQTMMANFKAMMENTEDYIYFKDCNHVFTGASQTLVAITSPSEHWEDLLGLTDYDVFPEELADVYYSLEKQIFEGQSVAHEIQETLTKDGQKGWVDNRKYPIKDDTGQIIGLFGIARDITERKQAEEALRESEERYKSLHNASFGGIAIHDQGVILECNQGLSEISGFSHEELIGMDGLLIISEKTRGMVLKNIREGYEKPYEAIGLRKNGDEYPVRLEARNIPYKGKSVRVVEFRDITEQKKQEAEREKLLTQLEQAQKMESIGRLAGGVAHDFNNMLGVILGYTELAMGRVEPGNPLLANLEKIQGAAQRSADLTGQLLAFARKQIVSPKVIDLNNTIESILKLLRRLIGEDIDLAWRPGKEVWQVKIDPTQIDQILANLCVNARDAIVDTGKVTIETGTASFDEEYCSHHRGFVQGDYVLLAVSDTGCGMDQETQSHLFEPFFTTKEMGKGTGLGLATVYGVVKQNNGFINVYSEPRQGTTFKIYLPRHLDKTIPLPEKEPDKPCEQGHETVLLVEDEPTILDMATEMLERLGYAVLAAGTPGEAIRLAQEHPGRIDLLLTDVVMPEMNGRDLAKNLLSLYPDIRRLFMSGYTANVIAHHGVLDEGVHFIQKPFSMKDLGEKLRETLKG